MKSPWQLIKGFASRRKVEDANVPADEVLVIPDPRTEEVRPDLAQRSELNAFFVIETKSTVDDDQPNAKPDAASAAAEPPARPEQSAPLLTEPKGSAFQSDSRLSKEVPSLPSAESVRGPSFLQAGSERKAANAGRVRKKLPAPSAATQAVAEAPTPWKAFTDDATELDFEIKSLRAQLSLRLIQQNAQLRQMLERYGDTPAG